MEKVMSMKFIVLGIIFVTCFYDAAAVMTPTVTIREEIPAAGSNRIRTNINGDVEILGLVGEPLVLECVPVNIDNSAKVYWEWKSFANKSLDFDTINNGMRAKDTSRWKVTRGVSSRNAIRLEIPTVSLSYAGKLACRVFYVDNTQPVTVTRDILVYAMPKIVQYQSSFESEVRENFNVTLRCNASGIPTPSIYWRRIGGDSAVIRGYGREFMGTKIVLQKARPSDRGTYLCRAFNMMGSVEWAVKLNVLFKPLVSIYTGSVDNQVSQKSGCTAQLMCSVTANPPITSLAWGKARSGTIKDDSKRVRIYQMAAADYTTYYSLAFEPTYSADYGMYTCTAINGQGSSSQTIQFTRSDTATADRSGRVLCNCNPVKASGSLLIAVLLIALLIRS